MLLNNLAFLPSFCNIFYNWESSCGRKEWLSPAVGVVQAWSSVKRFVTIHVHCIIGNLKRIAKYRRCPSLEKILRTLSWSYDTFGSSLSSLNFVLNLPSARFGWRMLHVWCGSIVVWVIVYFLGNCPKYSSRSSLFAVSTVHESSACNVINPSAKRVSPDTKCFHFLN